MKATCPKASYLVASWKMSVIRYADDFIVVHPDLSVIKKAKAFIEEWLDEIGLKLNPDKTRICHTFLSLEDKEPGFNFLGFHVRQYPVKSKRQGYATYIKPSKEAIERHLKKIRDLLRNHRGESQDTLIRNLNPIIKGWASYYKYAVARKVFERNDHQIFLKIWQWARFRHPHKGQRWIKDKYFPPHKGELWRFKSPKGSILVRHSDYKIKRFVKVKGNKSPYDGDFAYWATRMGRFPVTTTRKATLLKRQKGRCHKCKLYFRSTDVMEQHHINGNRKDNRTKNMALLHGHCHDEVHKKRGVPVKYWITEEPDDSKGSRPVLEPSMGGDTHA